MSTRTRILGGIAGVAVVAAGIFGVAAVGAQEGGDGTQDAPGRGEVFVQRVAENLGVTTDELKSAVKDAQLQGVEDALANDRITEEQAQTLRDTINTSEGLGLRGIIKHHDRMQERRGEMRRAFVETAAESIGITPEELREALQAGDTSIADVAAANGVSVDDVKADILAAAQEKLDAAVANGRITDTVATAAMQKLTDNVDEILSKTAVGARPSRRWSMVTGKRWRSE